MYIADAFPAYNSEIEDLKACISREFDDLQDLPYRLQSVFIHGGGGPNSGHYWVYIYDFAEKLWRVYNDGRVEEANYADVFPHDTPNSSATSYFLVYVKDDKKDELVNCVKRDPVQDEAQENPDTPMENRNDAAQPTQEYGGRDFNQESVRGGWYSDTAPAPRGEKW